MTHTDFTYIYTHTQRRAHIFLYKFNNKKFQEQKKNRKTQIVFGPKICLKMVPNECKNLKHILFLVHWVYKLFFIFQKKKEKTLFLSDISIFHFKIWLFEIGFKIFAVSKVGICWKTTIPNEKKKRKHDWINSNLYPNSIKSEMLWEQKNEKEAHTQYTNEISLLFLHGGKSNNFSFFFLWLTFYHLNCL